MLKPDCPQTARARTSQQTKQKRLCLVVFLMCRKDKVRPCFFRTLEKRLIPKTPGSILQGHLFVFPQFLRINRLATERNPHFPAKRLYITGIFQTLPAPDPMFYMTYGKTKSATLQCVCHGQRIGTSADCRHIVFCTVQFFPQNAGNFIQHCFFHDYPVFRCLSYGLTAHRRCRLKKQKRHPS